MGKISTHLSKLLKQGYSSRKLQTTFRKFYDRHTDLLVHKFDTSVSHMLKDLFTNCDILNYYFCMNRDGCHICGRKCSLFPEHLISLPLGSSRFHPFMIYTLQKLSVLGLHVCLRINDWFVLPGLISLLCLRLILL